MASKKISSKTLLWCFFAAAGKSSTKSSLARIPNEANRFVFTIMRLLRLTSLIVVCTTTTAWKTSFFPKEPCHKSAFYSTMNAKLHHTMVMQLWLLLACLGSNASYYYLNERRHHITVRPQREGGTRASSLKRKPNFSDLHYRSWQSLA